MHEFSGQSNARSHTLQKCEYVYEFIESFRVIKETPSSKVFWHRLHAKYLITNEYLLFQISVSFSGSSSNTKMMMHTFAEILVLVILVFYSWYYWTVKEALVFICKGCVQHIILEKHF